LAELDRTDLHRDLRGEFSQERAAREGTDRDGVQADPVGTKAESDWLGIAVRRDLKILFEVVVWGEAGSSHRDRHGASLWRDVEGLEARRESAGLLGESDTDDDAESAPDRCPFREVGDQITRPGCCPRGWGRLSTGLSSPPLHVLLARPLAQFLPLCGLQGKRVGGACGHWLADA
jgi:hypothetical protein